MLDRTEPEKIVRAAYAAYLAHDRAALEALFAPNYRFTSPLDNGIDRATYFERCWPSNADFVAFEAIAVAITGDRVYITYETTTREKRFRNTECHRIRDGLIVETEVYFGWDLPHPAKPGGFVEP